VLTLQEESLNWALNHALNVGDTDVFPAPFEYHALEQDWDAVRSELQQQDIIRWPTRPSRSLLSPKSKYGFRVITQLDPLDFVIYSALIKEIAQDLEARRISVENARVFSYRVDLNQDGQLFSPEVGYRQYLEECYRKIVNNTEINVVATTDISDFYSRIYHHRLENALRSATDKSSHISALMHLLSGWNGTESFGIPVGSAPSRILAEIALSDVDEALLANGVDFVRFNDDYRIFAQNHTQAYQHIAFLAEVLFRNHGLSLQPQKTSIYSTDNFTTTFLTTPLDREIDSLHSRFEALLEKLGIDSWYEPIEYDDLSREQQEIIDALNLSQLFRDELQKSEPDFPVIKFSLRRLGQLGDDSIADDIFDNLDSLIPAFVDVVNYFSKLRHLNDNARSVIGGKLLDLLDNSMVSELVYHRMWIMDLFTKSREWDNETRFFELYNRESQQACKRKLILAMGRAQIRYWFQSQWRSLFEHPHWSRRALIAAASCMPADARKHWYRSVEPQLDLLERAVMRWAKQNPFDGQ